MKEMLRKFVQEEEGASLVEYVLLVALIAVVAIAGMSTLGKASNTKLGAVGDKVDAVTVP